MLYIATGLVILVILAFIIRVIPHVLNDTTPEAKPEKAVPAFWVLIAITPGFTGRIDLENIG